MKHILLATLISIGLTIGISAKTEHHEKEMRVMSDKQIKKMDRKHGIHTARQRDFRTQKDFRHHSPRKYARNVAKHNQYNNRYNNEYNYERSIYRNDYRVIREKGYRHGKRGWTLAYRYDRAAFYDHEGYYYGFFNRNGYYFEDVFYRYDRYYSYRDRIRGRGLFDHRYYMPANDRYYGFCRAQQYTY